VSIVPPEPDESMNTDARGDITARFPHSESDEGSGNSAAVNLLGQSSDGSAARETNSTTMSPPAISSASQPSGHAFKPPPQPSHIEAPTPIVAAASYEPLELTVQGGVSLREAEGYLIDGANSAAVPSEAGSDKALLASDSVAALPQIATDEKRTEALQQEINDVVQRKLVVWREAKGKGNRFITVAEEADARRVLQQVEAAERGLSPPRVETQPVQTLERFFEKPIPPKEPLVMGLLYRRDIVALAGRRRHGKTTFIGNLALALVLGLGDFLGHPIVSVARVLVLYLEDDAGELQEKLKRMCAGRPAGERLALYTREDFYRANIPIHVTDKKFQDFVFGLCTAHRPDLIILDNLAHLVGGDYSNPKLIHNLNMFEFQLAQNFNAAIITPAHPRKRDKTPNALGFDSTPRLRQDPEGFFEEVMGSSHFVNSCGSLWGIERDMKSDLTDFLGGTQRLNGQQTMLLLQKEDGDWLQPIDDFEVKLARALNTPAREKAWALLPEGRYSYGEGEKAVKPAMKSDSTFSEWHRHCLEVGVVLRDGEHYKKARAGGRQNQPRLLVS